MGKFKVGDKVRILDGSKIKNYAGVWVKSMGRFVGKVETIYGIEEFSNGIVGYKLHNTRGFTFDERGLERCVNETIAIYRKGNEVIALDKATGKEAIAKCSPEDTFDFNIGAKLAFDRLMNSNKNTTVFKNGVKEIKRRAKKGEHVKIVDATVSYGNYKNGDILQIVGDVDYVRYGYNQDEILYDYEYVVLEGYKPDEPKEPHKFKVGDIVKGNLESNDRYCITNSNMTRGKVIYVLENGDIKIEVLNHKTMPDEVGEKFVCATKYFDLVEESPKLYNGKIIFVNGDDTFKTGRIYEVKDGRIFTLAYGSLPISEPLKDIEDAKDYFTGKLDGNRKREKGWSPYTLELMEVKED